MKKIKKLFNIFLIQLYLELKLQIRYVNSAISSLVLYAGGFLVVILFTNPAQLGVGPGIWYQTRGFIYHCWLFVLEYWYCLIG